MKRLLVYLCLKGLTASQVKESKHNGYEPNFFYDQNEEMSDLKS